MASDHAKPLPLPPIESLSHSKLPRIQSPCSGGEVLRGFTLYGSFLKGLVRECDKEALRRATQSCGELAAPLLKAQALSQGSESPKIRRQRLPSIVQSGGNGGRSKSAHVAAYWSLYQPTDGQPSQASAALIKDARKAANTKTLPRVQSLPTLRVARAAAEQRQILQKREAAHHAQSYDKEASNKKREACESGRILFLGRIGNEHWLPEDKIKIFDQRRGSNQDLEAFCKVWNAMDLNTNGFIEFSEFVEHFKTRKGAKVMDSVYCTRLVRALLGSEHQKKSQLKKSCLEIVIVSASGYRKSDGGVCSASDAYCTCEIVGKPNTRFRTKTVWNASSAQWCHRALVEQYEVGDSFLFKVWDEDIGQVDDFLGEAFLANAQFHPRGFDGSLRLSRAGPDVEAYLKVKVSGAVGTRRFDSRTSKGCSRLDVLQLLWMTALDEDLEVMEKYCLLYTLRQLAVPAPPVLEEGERRELSLVFSALTIEKADAVSFEALLREGLLSAHQVPRLQAQYDEDGTGFVGLRAFLEIFCPFGSRPFEDSYHVIWEDGRLSSYIVAEVDHVEPFRGWLYDDDFDKFESSLEFGREWFLQLRRGSEVRIDVTPSEPLRENECALERSNSCAVLC